MKKEDLLSQCLNLNKLLLQLKDENAFLRQQNKMIDNLIDKVNEKTSNQIHDTIKFNSIKNKPRSFIQNLYHDRQRHLFSRILHSKKFKQKT